MVQPVFFDFIRIHEFQINPAIVGNAAVDQGLVQAFVGIREVDVFADNGDGDLMAGVGHLCHDVFPGLQMGLARPDIQEIHDLFIDTLAMIDQGNLVDTRDVLGREDRFDLDVTKEGDLGFDVVG